MKRKLKSILWNSCSLNASAVKKKRWICLRRSWRSWSVWRKRRSRNYRRRAGRKKAASAKMAETVRIIGAAKTAEGIRMW